MDYETRRAIEEDEYVRHQARKQIAHAEARRAQEAVDAHNDRLAYIARHGREGAARLTMQKWLGAGAVLAVLSFFEGLSTDGFLASLGHCAAGMILFCGIGLYRANMIRNYH